MITPIRFCANYAKKDNAIEIESWINEPYRRKRQQMAKQAIQSDVYIKELKNTTAPRHSRKNASTKNKNTVTLKQLAAIGAATLALAGVTFVPRITRGERTEEQPSSSIVVEVPTSTSELIEEEIVETVPTLSLEEQYNIPDFEINLSEEQQASLESFIDNWHENRERYEQVSKQTNVPAQLIAAIHWRESGGNFGTYLHNGTKIGESLDTINGPKIFNSWEESALDALVNYGGNPDNIIQDDFQSYCDYAEHYNGMGYSKYHNINSPYVWAGTDKYTSGKYVQDGSFDPNTTDRQVGVAVMLKTLLELEEE